MSLRGDTALVVGLGGRELANASVAPSFAVPSATSADAELRIDAFLWNCGAGNVTWVYRPAEAPAPAVPGVPVVSTDPLSTDPLSTDPLSTDLVPPATDGGGPPTVVFVGSPQAISAAGSAGVVVAGMIAAAAIGMIAVAQSGGTLRGAIAELSRSISSFTTMTTRPGLRWPDPTEPEYRRPRGGDPGDPGGTGPWPAPTPRVTPPERRPAPGRAPAPVTPATGGREVPVSPIGGDPGDPSEPSDRTLDPSGQDATGGGAAG